MKNIYDFAEWCFRQRAEHLWNAAGVSFYEHLADEEITLRAMPHYVKPDVFADFAGLLEARMRPKNFAKLKAEFEKRNGI